MRDIVSRNIPDFFNRVKIPILANAGTEASATRVNTATGGGTNVKDCIRSKVLYELVVAKGSDSDDFLPRKLGELNRKSAESKSCSVDRNPRAFFPF